MPFFSLILPIYNVENQLRKGIDILLNESFKDYEMILVDDGAKDSCPQICDEYAEKYPFIRAVHKENGGLSSARNAGYDVAEGQYIFWIDSDDWIVEGALQKLHDAIVESQPDIVKFNYKTSPGGVVSRSVIKPGLYDEKYIADTIVPLGLSKTATINFSIWSHVYKKDFIERNQLAFVSERIIGSEDYLFNFQAYSRAKTMLVLDDVLYIYDFREDSLSHKVKPNQSEQYRVMYNQMVAYAKEKGIYEKYKGDLAYSYINKCFCICMRNECFLNENHNIFDAYRNCKTIMSTKEYNEAIKDYPVDVVSGSEKRDFMLLKHKITWLLMFMLIKGIRRNSKG